jgi:hypothetical protein
LSSITFSLVFWLTRRIAEWIHVAGKDVHAPALRQVRD